MSTSLDDILRKIVESQTVFKSVKLVNSNLIVVLNNGMIFTKFNATQEDYNKIVEAKSFIQIKEVVKGENEEQNEEEHVFDIEKIKNRIKWLES
jgi:hypothetical protein